MQKKIDAREKKATEALGKVDKHVKVWVQYEIWRLDTAIEEQLQVVKKLNPEAGGKTWLSKEEYDEVMKTNKQMSKLIDRVKALEKVAKE